MKFKPQLVKFTTIILIVAFTHLQLQESFAFENLSASLISDNAINVNRSKSGRSDVAERLEPGAIGRGAPLVDILNGKFPEKIELSADKVNDSLLKDLRKATDLAIRLHLKKRRKIPLQHQSRAENTLKNLILLKNELSTRVHLYKAIVKDSEEYLLGFNCLDTIGTVGLSIEIVDYLSTISTKRLAQYIYHECVPEHSKIIGDNQVNLEDHRTIYSEIQVAVFGKWEVLALKKNLRKYIRSNAEETSEQEDPVSNQRQDISIHKSNITSAVNGFWGDNSRRSFDQAIESLTEITHNLEDYMFHLQSIFQMFRKLKNDFAQILASEEVSREEKATIFALVHKIALNSPSMDRFLRKQSPQIFDIIMTSDNSDGLFLVSIYIFSHFFKEGDEYAKSKAEDIISIFDKVSKNPRIPIYHKRALSRVVLIEANNGNEAALEILDKIITDIKSDVTKSLDDVNSIAATLRYIKENFLEDGIIFDKAVELLPVIMDTAFNQKLDKKARMEYFHLIRVFSEKSPETVLSGLQSRLQAIENLIFTTDIQGIASGYCVDYLMLLARQGNDRSIDILKRLIPRIVDSILTQEKFWIRTNAQMLGKIAFINISEAVIAIDGILTDPNIPIEKKEGIVNSFQIFKDDTKDIPYKSYVTRQIIPSLVNIINLGEGWDENNLTINRAIITTFKQAAEMNDKESMEHIIKLSQELDGLFWNPEVPSYFKDDIFKILVHCSEIDPKTMKLLPKYISFLESGMIALPEDKKEKERYTQLLQALGSLAQEENAAAVNILQSFLKKLIEKIESEKVVFDENNEEIMTFAINYKRIKIKSIAETVEKLIPYSIKSLLNDKCSDRARERIATELLFMASESNSVNAFQAFLDLLSDDRIERRGSLMSFLFDYIVRGNYTAYLIVKMAFDRRGSVKVLPEESVNGEVKAFIIDMQRSHADMVESIFKTSRKNSGDVEVVLGNKKEEDWIETTIDKIVSENTGNNIVINLSMGDMTYLRKDYSKVGGILDFEKVAAWGRQGVVFVISSGNESTLSEYSHPVLDNVLLVGAGSVVDGELEKESYACYNLDLFCVASGEHHTSFEDVHGTSFSAPRIAGLLVRILENNPHLNIPEAINSMRGLAQPLETSSLFKLGFLGNGYIDADNVEDSDIDFTNDVIDLNVDGTDMYFEYQGVLFLQYFMDILSKNPEKTYLFGIDKDISEYQHAQMMPIYKALRYVKDLRNDDGTPLFPNLIVVEGSGKTGEIMQKIKDSRDSANKAINKDNIFVITSEENVDAGIFQKIQGQSWITSIEGTNTHNLEYYPIFEAISLSLMSAFNSDIESIKDLYDEISGKSISIEDLETMIKNRFFSILPKITAHNTQELIEMYEKIASIVTAA